MHMLFKTECSKDKAPCVLFVSNNLSVLSNTNLSKEQKSTAFDKLAYFTIENIKIHAYR